MYHENDLVRLLMGQLEQALGCLKQALALYEQIGDSDGIVVSLDDLCFIYHQAARFEEALYYYERTLTLLEQIGNPIKIAGVLNNIADIYRQQRKLTQAIERYTKALGLYENLGNGFESKLVTVLEALAACYALSGEFVTAFDYGRRATQIRDKIGETQ